MNEHEQISDEKSDDGSEATPDLFLNNATDNRQDLDEYDYNREPPLDQATTRANRDSSKYVFATLCFLLALVLFYVHINGTFASDSENNWFPLVGAIILAIAGAGFLLSREHSSEARPDGLSSGDEEPSSSDPDIPH
jgi:LPXTG-motif cell wall-anchored protein